MCLSGLPGDTLSEWSQPWVWFDPLTFSIQWVYFCSSDPAGDWFESYIVECINTRGAPNEKEHALRYIDTIIGYLAPRLCIAMDIPAQHDAIEVSLEEQNIHIYPNPSQADIEIEYTGVETKSIQSIQVMDISGRMVRSYANINRNRWRVERGNLLPGIYLVQIRVGDQFINKKVVFH